MELKLILEAILFSAQKPLSLKELRDVFAAAVAHAEGDETVRALKKVKESDLTAALETLAKDVAGPTGASLRPLRRLKCFDAFHRRQRVPWFRVRHGPSRAVLIKLNTNIPLSRASRAS